MLGQKNISKEEAEEVLEKAYVYCKKLLTLWHEYQMSKIRLESANRKHLEEYKHQVRIDQIKYGSKVKNRNWERYPTREKDDGLH